MQVVFVSNYFNHHQLSFCDALYELLEGSFCFLQTQPMEEERVKMGWQAKERPYVRYVQPDGTTTGGSEAFMGRNPDEETAGHEWRHLLLTADVVIFGGCDDERRENLSSATTSGCIKKDNGKPSLPEDCCKSIKTTPDTARHRCTSCVPEPMCPATWGSFMPIRRKCYGSGISRRPESMRRGSRFHARKKEASCGRRG